MKQVPLEKFRHIYANVIIGIMLTLIACITLISSSTLAFSSGENAYAIRNGNTKSNNVTLMINVYWGNEFIEPMLDTLKKENVKTTFFIGGSWAFKHNELLKKIYQDGHEIGNHGFNHKDHSLISEERCAEEIMSCHNIVSKVLGIKMNLFAPPSGAFNNDTIKKANELGYKTILWSKDTIDWKDKNAKLITERATKNARGGDLILMHPTKSTNDALAGIIHTLKQKGLNLTTVSNNIVPD
ncbi:MAG: polysaccharide deacetylase family protein [Clostridia bacterium]